MDTMLEGRGTQTWSSQFAVLERLVIFFYEKIEICTSDVEF
jgi:hypothetical protein